MLWELAGQVLKLLILNNTTLFSNFTIPSLEVEENNWFKNTRNYPVKILCTVSGGVAKCEIYGLKENPDYDVEITSRVTETTATSIKSETYKTVRQNGQVISSERINKDTYKRH